MVHDMARCDAKLAILSGTGIPTIKYLIQVIYLPRILNVA
jgi:hypothetical protein